MKDFILLPIILLLCVIAPFTSNAVNPRTQPCPFTINFEKNLTLHFSKNGQNYKNDPVDGYFTKGKKTILFVLGFCGKVTFNNPNDYTSFLPPRLLESDRAYENIIIVQYSNLCCDYYNFIQKTIKEMGDYVARYLLDLEVTPDMIFGVGHSVGSHILDAVSTAFQSRGLGKIHVIWGICPARDGYIDEPFMQGLNKNSADTVIQVYTDNVGPYIPRGTVNYFVNPGCKIQPGCYTYECNHFACLTILYLAFHPKSISDEEAFVGEKCFQDIEGCQTNDETSKLRPSSGEQRGCFCVNVDTKPPYFPSEPACAEQKNSFLRMLYV